VPGALRGVIGGAGPLTPVELERAVKVLQASPATCKDVIVELATEAALRGHAAHAEVPVAGVEIMQRLSEAYAELGFFRFMAALAAERGPLNPLLPIEGIPVGGLPMPGARRALEDFGTTGGGVLGVLRAIGVGEGGPWLPTVFKAVEDLVRERQVKKSRDQYFRALEMLGMAASDALRRRSPAGQALRQQVYSALDAYRTLDGRVKAQFRSERGIRLVPTVESALRMGLASSLARAIVLVSDKCQSLEKLLMGREGMALAGEVLFRHKDGLLSGVAPDAFAIEPLQAAYDEYQRAKQMPRAENA
jgi:hypothetical protein